MPALKRQTQLDPKTGLYNARYFQEALEREIARSDRSNHPMTVVVADLDLLRNINNTYGHLAGDQVLVGVANILKAMVREYDVVARFGGEEYTILMPEMAPEDALERVEAIRRQSSRPDSRWRRARPDPGDNELRRGRAGASAPDLAGDHARR